MTEYSFFSESISKHGKKALFSRLFYFAKYYLFAMRSRAAHVKQNDFWRFSKSNGRLVMTQNKNQNHDDQRKNEIDKSRQSNPGYEKDDKDNRIARDEPREYEGDDEESEQQELENRENSRQERKPGERDRDADKKQGGADRQSRDDSKDHDQSSKR